MDSKDKKKIIIAVVPMVILMIGLSIFMRTGMEDIKTKRGRMVKQQDTSSQTEQPKKKDGIEAITVRIADGTFIMSVADNDAAQEFAKSTPFELEMVDLNGNEKYFEGNETLPASPSKPGHVNVGDVMLYGDKTIVIFYKSFDTDESYTKLGNIMHPDPLEYLLEGEKATVEFYK